MTSHAQLPKSSERRVSQGGEGVPRYVGEAEQKRLAIKALEEGRSDVATQRGWDLAREVTDELVELMAKAIWVRDYEMALGREADPDRWPDIEDPDHYRALARAAAVAFSTSRSSEEA